MRASLVCPVPWGLAYFRASLACPQSLYAFVCSVGKRVVVMDASRFGMRCSFMRFPVMRPSDSPPGHGVAVAPSLMTCGHRRSSSAIYPWRSRSVSRMNGERNVLRALLLLERVRQGCSAGPRTWLPCWDSNPGGSMYRLHAPHVPVAYSRLPACLSASPLSLSGIRRK